MAVNSRESVYQALFALITPLGPVGSKLFKTVSREVVPVQSISPALQPIIMQDEAFEDWVSAGRGLFHNLWTVYFHIGITTKKGSPGAAALNPLIDAVEGVLKQAMREFPDLGGLVTDFKFSGRAMKDSGDNSTDPSFRQAIYYLPIELKLPS